MAKIMSFKHMENLSIQELCILKLKVETELRERRIRKVMKHRRENNNPRVQQMYQLLEREMSKNLPQALILDEYLDMLECILHIEID